MNAFEQQPTNESKAMKTTLKQQLQILTFADAEWKTERKYKHAINDAWFLHPQDVQFDFAHYDYRIVLPPLPEGYDIVPIGDAIESDIQIIWVTAEGGCTWTGGQADYDFAHDRTHVIYAVKRQTTYIERHKASGLKVGDRVRVTRKAGPHESGWKNTWATHMDGLVGKAFEITKDYGETGFLLGLLFELPYFVLEKVTTQEAPLTMDDLPKGAGLWLEFGMSIYQVLEIKPDGVITRDGSFWRFTLIHEKRGRFSVDRSEWVNGWKELEV